MTFQYTILHSMESELRMHVNDTNTYDVIGELDVLRKLESTKSQIRVMEYEYMDGVSFNYDGRNNLLGKSLGKMYKIHEHLV